MRAQCSGYWACEGEFFRKAGGNPFLLIQAAEDYIAPPEKAGLALKAELGEQVTYVEIPETGHALSSERPDEIAKHIINYFAK
jgi:pimeloyl-ACP methyl ester carboxylesterase